MALSFGSWLNERYRIVSILGQGGMGAVYCAVDENLGVTIAVKENLFLTEEYARQFQREASILASLRHPNLPRVGDYFTLPGQGQYLIMDYIDGEDLRQRIERVGAMSEREVILIGAAICDALTYLHNRQPPVIHRDIKPGNIKITPEGEIILVDFGLAKVMQGSQATTTGARAMTPGYSPPEQYGTARTDARSDVYSLGATLYAALTGTVPEDALARATGKAELTTLRRLRPKLNKKLASAIEKSLAVEPEDRYQTADDYKKFLLEAGDLLAYSKGKITIVPAPSGVSTPAIDTPLPAGMGQLANEQNGFPLLRKSSKSRKIRNRNSAIALVGLLILLVLVFLIPQLPLNMLAMLTNLSTRIPTEVVIPTQASPDLTIPVSLTQATSVIATEPSSTYATTPTITTTPTHTTIPTITDPPTVSPVPSQTPTTTPTPTITITAVPTVLGGSTEFVYTSDRSGSMQIWIMDILSRRERQLTELDGGACQPAWSPDGKSLAFISPCKGKSDTFPAARIWLMNADGTNANLLPITANPAGDYDPAWSPDGRRIAFTSLRGQIAHIYVFDFDTNDLVEISSSRFAERAPAWATNGSDLIAFVKATDISQIWLMGADGSDPQQYSGSSSYSNIGPAWSPNGTFILFSQMDKDARIPWLVSLLFDDRNTKNEKRIVLTGQFSAYPVANVSFSPDGNWLLFESWPDGKNHDIYLMNLSGAGIRRLTTNLAFDFNQAWRPAVQP
jgi:serine/threonine protein kinase/Tol biopolymer transport system component